MKTRLGRREMQVLAHAQLRGLRTVRTGDLTGPLQLTRVQERELLHRMARGGLVVRVRRGLYLVPSRLPLGGSWSPGEGLALSTLFADCEGRYQVCGPNAFNRYGLDEQVPNRTYVYNNRISGERTVGANAFTLIKVSDDRLGDTEEASAEYGTTILYSSRTRTLVDAVYDWSRFDGLPRAYGWIRRELASGRVRPGKLVDVALCYGDTGMIRRMGLFLEQEGARRTLVRRLQRAVRPTTSTIPWIPSKPKRGTVNRRWGVVVNGQA